MGPLRAMVDDAWDAFHREDYDDGMRHFSPDCEVFVPGLGRIDWAAWKGVVQAYFTGHPDFLVQLTESVEDEGTLSFLFVATGTHDGFMPHPEGHVPPTGRLFDVSGACFARVTDGLITYYHLFFDDDSYFEHQRVLNAKVEPVGG